MSTSPRWNWFANLRIVVKAALLFVVLNGLFALLDPVESIGRISVYNTILPGRERLPYGENPAESYNLSLFNIPAMFATHEVAASPAGDEFRVLLVGDSATWGWLLEPDTTTTARLNSQNLTTSDGQRMTFYNVGYPALALSKDLLLLDYALRFDPDLIIWLVTLESFVPENQLSPLVENNPRRMRDLIDRYDLTIDPENSRFLKRDFIDQTIVGQRRALANWLRLQGYAFSWASTGIDHTTGEYDRLTTTFEDDDIAWEGYDEPVELTADDLAFDMLMAGMAMTEDADVPVLLVNEPIFISNSESRYNLWYPRWAYDAYRDLLATVASASGWAYVDLWDTLPPRLFTDSPVHFEQAGVIVLGDALIPAIQALSP